MRSRGCLALLFALLSAHSVWAHGLGAECRIRGDKIEVTAFYDDDTPASNARVSVFDGDKKEAASGRTDAKGLWTFPLPAPGKYVVVVDAGAGHRATRKITVPDESRPAEAGSDPLISEGPSREEFTRFPWLNLGVGLGLIAVVSLTLLGFAWWRRAAAVR